MIKKQKQDNGTESDWGSFIMDDQGRPLRVCGVSPGMRMRRHRPCADVRDHSRQKQVKGLKAETSSASLGSKSPITGTQ